jgi:Protein kinase domain/Sel1 repeat
MSSPTHLGKYRIRRRLGQGSMGIVYEGFDPQIERVVAIKVLAPSPADAAVAADLGVRFRREAQAVGRLGHPNIVAVHEFRDDLVGADGEPCACIVMEYVAGRTLKECFDAGTQFSLADVGQIMGELLAALGHAHEHGVVHRDIKPANVMLLDSGRVKVTDFGVARLDASDLTLTGTMIGTIAFMAPEQFMGQPVDGRADVFSCGVLLYRFLTGELPFSGSSTSTIQKLLNQEPLAPSTLNRTLSPAWDPVVRKALAKSPAERFQDAPAFASAIRQAMTGDDGPTIASPPPALATPSPANRWPIAAWSAGALLVAGGLAVYLGARDDRRGHDADLDRPAPVIQGSAASPAPPPLAAASTATAGTTAANGAAASGAAEDVEQQAWDDARAADNALAYQAFLDAYPSGRFAVRARIRLAGLRPKPANAVVAAPPPAPVAPTVVSPRPVAPEATPAKARDGAAPATAAVTATVPTPSPQAAPTKARDSTAAPSPRLAPAPTASAPSSRFAAAASAPTAATRDPATSLDAYRKAAEHGDAEAQFRLGLMYLRGQGVQADKSVGFDWVHKAAAQGHAAAQNRLGNAYEDGAIGVHPNLVSASDWYARAAAQGNGFAQASLGKMYLQGRGVFKDADKARALLTQSCEGGNGYGCYHLATMYEEGNGVAKDAAQATRWYREALARRTIAQTKLNEHATAFVAKHP